MIYSLDKTFEMEMNQENNNLEVAKVETAEKLYEEMVTKGNFKIVPKIKDMPFPNFGTTRSGGFADLERDFELRYNYNLLKQVNYQFTIEDLSNFYKGILKAKEGNEYAFVFIKSGWEDLVTNDEMGLEMDWGKLSLLKSLLQVMSYSKIIKIEQLIPFDFNNREGRYADYNDHEFCTELNYFLTKVNKANYSIMPSFEELVDILKIINYNHKVAMEIQYGSRENTNKDIITIKTKIESTPLSEKVKEYFLLLANELDSCWQNQLVYAGIGLCGKMMEVMMKELLLTYSNDKSKNLIKFNNKDKKNEKYTYEDINNELLETLLDVVSYHFSKRKLGAFMFEQDELNEYYQLKAKRNSSIHSTSDKPIRDIIELENCIKILERLFNNRLADLEIK
jgi:hypothetical protein